MKAHRPRYQYETTNEAVEVENLFSWKVWSQLLPEIKPRKWSSPRAVEDGLLAQTRIGSLADWACGHLDELPVPAESKTFEAGKTKAAKAFAKLVAEEKITWPDVGERAQRLTLKLVTYLRDSMRAAVGTTS